MLESLDFSTAYPDILLLVTAPGCDAAAEALHGTLTAHGFDVSRVTIAQADPEFLLDFHQLILCCAGDELGMTEPAAEFIDELARRAPDLSHLGYGVLSLAQQPAPPAAADRFQSLLHALGAVEVVDRLSLMEAPPEGFGDRLRQWSLGCAAAFAEAFAPVAD